MWCIDLFHDLEWTKQNGKTMKPQIEGNLTFATSPHTKAKLQIFGDEYEVRHARIVLDANSKEETEQFINNHLHKIQTSLEVFISLTPRQPFYFKKVPIGHGILMSYGEYSPGSSNPPLEITPVYGEPQQFDYNFLKNALASQFPGLETYLVYLQRGMDTTLEWDYRWINYYKICEVRFNAQGGKLVNSPGWRQFLAYFEDKLKPYLVSPQQKLWGLIEQWRVLAYHSIGEGGVVNFGNPFDGSAAHTLVKTLPILEAMAQKIINDLPENRTGLKFFQIDTASTPNT